MRLAILMFFLAFFKLNCSYVVLTNTLLRPNFIISASMFLFSKTLMVLSLKLFLGCSYILAKFKPRVLIKLFLWKKACTPFSKCFYFLSLLFYVSLLTFSITWWWKNIQELYKKNFQKKSFRSLVISILILFFN